MSEITDQELLDAKVLLRPDEAARILRVDRRSVYYWCRMGLLDTIKVGGSIRIKSKCIQDLLDQEL